MLATMLGFSDTEIDVIMADVPTTTERALKMLNVWYQQEGIQADLQELRSKVERIPKQQKERKQTRKQHNGTVTVLFRFLLI